MLKALYNKIKYKAIDYMLKLILIIINTTVKLIFSPIHAKLMEMWVDTQRKNKLFCNINYNYDTDKYHKLYRAKHCTVEETENSSVDI